MKKIILAILAMVLMAGTASAAILNWQAVESTETCTIVGYKAYFVSENPEEKVIEVETDNLSIELGEIGLVDGVTYDCMVAAVSSNKYIGLYSEPIKYNSEWPFPGKPENASIHITFEIRGDQE